MANTANKNLAKILGPGHLRLPKARAVEIEARQVFPGGIGRIAGRGAGAAGEFAHGGRPEFVAVEWMRLGHSDVGTTLRTYSHVSPRMRDKSTRSWMRFCRSGWGKKIGDLPHRQFYRPVSIIWAT